MSTSHVLLGLLSRGERHGYELKREYDARFPQARPLGFGQVYATLERLRRDGLVVPTKTERAEGPERTAYAVTDAGRAALQEWLATVEPPAPYVSNALFAKVAVAVLAGPAGGPAGGVAGGPAGGVAGGPAGGVADRVADGPARLAADGVAARVNGGPSGAAGAYLRAQRAAHLARMREYTQIKTNPASSMGDVLAADYALVHLDADLQWIDTALSRVGALAMEVLS